jgi:hypothetical protein
VIDHRTVPLRRALTHDAKGIYQQLIANGCAGAIYRPDSFITREQKAHLRLSGFTSAGENAPVDSCQCRIRPITFTLETFAEPLSPKQAGWPLFSGQAGKAVWNR